MPSLKIIIPDRIKAMAEARVAERHDSMDDYIAELIESDHAIPIDAELEADLLRGLTSDARELTSADWDQKRQRLRERPPAPVRK